MSREQATPLTTTELLAATVDFLLNGGYMRLEEQERSGEWASNSRLFEDSYGIVAVVVYESWSELSDTWPDDQERLVELISRHIRITDPKAWDGYLVLLTPGVIPSRNEELQATSIRYNTSRLRKLLATGEELQTLRQLKRLLMPLLPLDSDGAPVERKSPLATLPDLLARKGIPLLAAEAVVEAFTDQESLMEALDQVGHDG